MRYATLDTVGFPAIHETFVEAFSDYVTPFRLSEEELAEMARRRGVRFDLSVGAFDGDRLEGITLNGLGRYGGVLSGYDSGTGVVPGYRGRGIAREMMVRSFALLRGAKAKRYILEVIDSNHRAAEIYRSIGFTETRGLLCWTYDGAAESGEIDIAETRRLPAVAMRAFMDVEPSWQNSAESIRRARAPRSVLVARSHGEIAGFAVLFPGNGDLAQLAVRPDRRCLGIGRALLGRARGVADKPLRILNTDERNAAVTKFFQACGASPLLRQLEMSMEMG